MATTTVTPSSSIPASPIKPCAGGANGCLRRPATRRAAGSPSTYETVGQRSSTAWCRAVWLRPARRSPATSTCRRDVSPHQTRALQSRVVMATPALYGALCSRLETTSIAFRFHG
jgi:hypothetical protein